VLGYEYIKKASLAKSDEKSDEFFKRKLREHSHYGDIDDVNLVSGVSAK